MSDLDVGPMVDLAMGLSAARAALRAAGVPTEGELMTQRARVLAGVR